MKRYLSILFLLLGQLLCFAQQYPVRLVPVVFPPYNVRLSDYALNSEPKLQLQVLMTDLLEPPHKTGIKFSLESGGRVIAVSTPFINGLDPFMLQPGNNISLSNLDLKPLFKLENLSGISPANYAKALPDGLYQYCFQAYDFYTKNNLSQKSCASVYQVLYEPPFLNLPQKGEKVTKKAEFQGVVFNWSPRQVAPNTKYIFTLKEIWDKQRNPVSAFLAARVLWKEESFAPSLYYGVDKTQLIPGRRYAWQVQAVSGTPQYNHSPIQEGGVYKNNGLSEIFFFDYVENCPVPAFLMAKTTARGRAEIQWMLQGASSKLFRVEYRKKGSSSPWLSETSYQTSAILSGLENNTEYEYRVGAVCGENKSFDPNDLSQADAFAYSGVQYFTTNFSNQNKNSAQCGVMPHVDLANKKPYDRQLTPNEVFTAGDFPVTVITAQGTAGNYTGEGFIQVPYLADTKIKVKFNNIQLNSDKQLINGTVETEYDANESAVHYASAGLGEIFGDKGIKDIKINYKIEKITLVMTPAPGVLRIVGIDPNGENKGPVQELPAGRDYTITDSSGKIWQVDEQGTVTEGEEIAKSGKSNADNTEGVKTSASGNISEITQYSANGVAIKWISMKDSHFYFDTPDITKIPFDRYPQVKDTKGRNIVIPYKAVVKGQKEFIGARIIIEDPKLKEAKIEFKVLGSGKLINAELVSNTGNQREYNLELKGVFSYGEEEIMAVLLPSENQQKTNKEDKKQKIIGSFRLVHLEPKNVNLSLVPLDKASEAELDTIAKNIHNTYSRAGINFDIKKQPVLDISAITTKDIDTPDDNPLSHYSKMQQSINRLYPAKNNEYVLFITEKASSTGQKGFMPLGGQYGYAYKSKDKNTPAHELGHGVFRLEHPWSNKLIKTPRASTNLLMDYAGAAELSHFDWKQINDPKIKIYAFQKQTEGEALDKEFILHEDGYFITPSNKLIKLPKGTRIIFYCNIPQNHHNNVLHGFEIPGGYRWDNNTAYHLNNKEFKGFYKVKNDKWVFDKQGNHELYTDPNFKYNGIKTYPVYFIQGVYVDSNNYNYNIYKGNVNINSEQISNNPYFTGEIQYNISRPKNAILIDSIKSTRCATEVVKETIVTIADHKGKYEIIVKNNNGKFSVSFTLKQKGSKKTQSQKKQIEQQIASLMEEKLNELGGLDGKKSAKVALRTQDGGEFWVKEMSGREWLSTIGELGESVWENAALPENYWNKDQNYNQSNIHVPPLFAGVSDGVVEEVSNYPQLIKLGYDVASKKEVREGLWNSVKNISTESIKNAATDFYEEKKNNYTSDKSYIVNHTVGKDAVQVASILMGGGAIKSLKNTTDNIHNGVKKVGNEIKEKSIELVGKYDWNLVRKYFKHIQEVTGKEIHQKQIDKLKDALRKKEYKKLPPDEYSKHTKNYTTTKREELIKKWEEETGQKWPVDEKGRRYQLHHIIEQQYGGEHEWWNIHPAKFPDQHQGGIHGANSPSREIFK